MIVPKQSQSGQSNAEVKQLSESCRIFDPWGISSDQNDVRNNQLSKMRQTKESVQSVVR